jgi:hypothetical protein
MLSPDSKWIGDQGTSTPSVVRRFWTYRYSFDHRSQATLGRVSTWMDEKVTSTPAAVRMCPHRLDSDQINACKPKMNKGTLVYFAKSQREMTKY